MHCLECNSLMEGRKDKRFCSDACRVHYHNKTSIEFNTLKRSINKILVKNRNILKKIFYDGMKTIDEKQLIGRDFNFNYHTATFTSKNVKTYYYCYDYGYCNISPGKFLVVQSNKKGV